MQEVVELVSGPVVETKERSGSFLVLDGLVVVELEDVGDFGLGLGLHLHGLAILVQLGLIFSRLLLLLVAF